MDISLVITQMGILVLMMLLGFVCARCGITGQQFNKSVSAVSINVLLVATILGSAMNSTMGLSMGVTIELVGISTLMLVISGLVGLAMPRLLRVKGDDRGLVFFMVFLMNTVFVAFPVVEALYGADGLLMATVSNIPFNMLAYSVGAGAVRGEFKGLSLKKMIPPPLIATVIALIINLTGVKFPAVIVQTCTSLGRATVPMSMLVIGTSLGMVPIKSSLGNWRVYVISLVRLILCPIVTWLILGLFVKDKMILAVFTILASAPVPMLAAVFPIQYDKNESLGSQGIFISTLLSALTMPFVIWLLL